MADHVSRNPLIIMWGRFWEARTINEFWRTWNPSAVKIYSGVFRWLCKRISWAPKGVVLVVMFIINGAFHDLVLMSIPALLGYGFRPLFTIFFLLNGLALVVERPVVKNWSPPTLIGRVYTMGSILLLLNVSSYASRLV